MPIKKNKRVAHIDVFFAKYFHNDSESFDGAGGMVAHTAYPIHGVVHFDASEKWSVDGKESINNEKYVDLRYVSNFFYNFNILKKNF